jgi:threonine/homoserine/homoserine lactone efflux protein
VQLAIALVFGLALGFSLTISPGPMNALIASQTVLSLRRGILTGVGAMTADLVLGVLVYALRAEIDVGAVVRAVYVGGAVVMVFFGCRLLLRARAPTAEQGSEVRTYAQAVLLGISNPFQIVWWLTAGLAFAYLGGPVLFVGLFTAIGIWVVVFPYALHLGTRRHADVGRVVAYVSSAVMFVFAAYFLILAW